MPTFDEAVARSDGHWIYAVRIQGFGYSAGPFTWCDGIPRFAQGDPTWIEGLAVWPDPLSEEAEELGGATTSGSITLDLVDIAGPRPAFGEGPEMITAAMALDRPPRTRLAADIDRDDTSLTITGSGLSSLELPAADDVVWIGAEAIYYATRTGGTLSGCVRGFLGTDAGAHRARDGVFTLTPSFIRARRISVYLIPEDALTDITDDCLLEEYRLDRCWLLSDKGEGVAFSTYRITGTSKVGYLGRQIAGRLPIPMKVQEVTPGGSIYWTPAQNPGPGTSFPFLRGWPDGLAFVEIDKEILRVRLSPSAAIEQIEARQQMGTSEGKIELGSIIRQVLTADPLYGSFRVSPGSSPSMDRASGTWNVTANWIDLLLCLLLSSAADDDGLELVNHAGVGGLFADASLPYQARSNWSSLPVGWGAGIPADQIDLEAFINVRRRTLGYDFPNVVVREPVPAAKWLTDNFLRPLGAFLATANGRMTIVLPRLPLTGETTVRTWDEDTLLEVGDCEVAMAALAGGISYVVPGPRGEPMRQTFRASDVGIRDQQGYYLLDDKPTEIEVPGARADQAGLSAFLARIAQRRLLRFVRPHWRIPVVVPISEISAVVGSLIHLTHFDLANLGIGARGVVELVCQIVERRIRMDERRGPVIHARLVAYPGTQRGARIAPSAMIALYVGTTSGDDVVEVVVNRYTSPSNDLLGLPETDADAFRVGDVVLEIGRDGVAIGTPRAVTAVDSGTQRLTLDGISTPSPSIGNVITFADYSDEVEAQTSDFVSLADEGTIEVVSGVPAYLYAET